LGLGGKDGGIACAYEALAHGNDDEEEEEEEEEDAKRTQQRESKE